MMKKSIIAALLGVAALGACVSSQKINMAGTPVDEAGAPDSLSIYPSILTSNKGDLGLDFKTTDSSKLKLSKSDEVLKLEFSDVKGEAIYQDYDGYDFRGKLAVKIEARIVSGDPKVKLRVRMQDQDGLVSNGKDIDNTVELTNGYKPYFFRLKGGFMQTFPELKSVNGAAIKKLSILVSPTQKGSAVIEIKSIKIVSDQEVFSGNKIKEEGKQNVVIYDQGQSSVLDNLGGSNLYAATVVGEDLVFDVDNAGIRYEYVEIPVELSSTKKLKFTAKYEGGVQPYVRFDLVDVNGFVTNRKPGMVRLQPGDYQDYEIDYSDRARQSYPLRTDVDLTRIAKVRMYVNPAFMPYEGVLFFKSIML